MAGETEDITDRIPQAFIDAAAKALTNSDAESVFGVSADNFQTWEFTEF